MKDKANQKKEQILKAAFKCFMQYGYSKTTFNDIARLALISRPLIYMYFKNKNDLFTTMNDEFHQLYVARSRKILESNRPENEKLNAIIDVWIIEPYRLITNTPSSDGWLDGLKNISSQSEINFRALFIKSIAPLTGEEIAEIIVLSIRGLMDDRPPVKTLKRRIVLLVNTLI